MATGLSAAAKTATDPRASAKHAVAGMKAVFALAALWKLDNEQLRVLLGQPSERTLYNWKAGKVALPSRDTMSRIGYLLGIHRALRTVFANSENVYGWVSRSNADFGGQSPLQRMLGGELTDLASVRQYVDSLRGGWS